MSIFRPASCVIVCRMEEQRKSTIIQIRLSNTQPYSPHGKKLPVFLIKKTGEEVLPEPSGTMIRGQRFPIPPGEGCIVKV